MGLLGFLVAIAGGIGCASDYCTKQNLKQKAYQNAVESGCPYSVDVYGEKIYLPTGEKCLEFYRNGERILVNKRTHREVFNITKWEQRERIRMFIEKAKKEALEKNSSYVVAKFEGEYSDAHKLFIFDVDSMEARVVYRKFPYVGDDYEIADVRIDEDGKIHYENIQKCNKEVYDTAWAAPWCYVDMPKSLKARQRLWGI